MTASCSPVLLHPENSHTTDIMPAVAAIASTEAGLDYKEAVHQSCHNNPRDAPVSDPNRQLGLRGTGTQSFEAYVTIGTAPRIEEIRSSVSLQELDWITWEPPTLDEIYPRGKDTSETSDGSASTEPTTATNSDPGLTPGILVANRSMEGAEKAYQYEPISENQIRLVLLKPGGYGDAISASLIVVNDFHLGVDRVPYAALSYTWGNSQPSKTITVDGKMMRITANLSSALRHLRRSDHVVSMWIDAICINQDDLQEKSRQVRLMGEIYSAAYNVCVWLGSDDNPTLARAMRFIPEVLDLDKHSQLLNDTSKVADWASLYGLLSRRW